MAEAPNEVALDANKKSYRTKGKTINNGQLLRGTSLCHMSQREVLLFLKAALQAM